jgi:hypothetical protein
MYVYKQDFGLEYAARYLGEKFAAGHHLGKSTVISLDLHTAILHAMLCFGFSKDVFGSRTRGNGMEWFRSEVTGWFRPRVRFGKERGTERFHPCVRFQNEGEWNGME